MTGEMEQPLQGKAALVTAGSRGLGEQIVRCLAAMGASVAFTYKTNATAAQQLSETIVSLGCQAISFQADARDFSRAAEVVGAVQDAFSRLDILICNAAAAASNPIWRMTEEEWDVAVDTTLKGAFNYIRAVAPIFAHIGNGKIVCVGSINGLRGRIGTVSYNAAKAGLVGLVKTCAAELGRHNVNVNLVAPGFIETESQSGTPELIRQVVLNECAIKRLGTPQDIAPVVAFLCTEDARHLTGQVLKADAGQYL